MTFAKGQTESTEDAYEMLEYCYKNGINFFDCALRCHPSRLNTLMHSVA